jgi:shikimate kinase
LVPAVIDRGGGSFRPVRLGSGRDFRSGHAFSLSIFDRILQTVNPAGKSIVLIGMTGTGKSSVGRCLERRTGFARFDTDDVISARFEMSIQDIFAKYGEEKFREAETEALNSLTNGEPAIIVTGGGIVTKAKNIDLLKKLGTVVWLDADHATLRTRINQLSDRPLLQTSNPPAALSELLQSRNPLYRNTADIRVDTAEKQPDEIAEVILNTVRNFPIGE